MNYAAVYDPATGVNATVLVAFGPIGMRVTSDMAAAEAVCGDGRGPAALGLRQAAGQQS